MSDTCGCCEGIRLLTPSKIVNRPGLSQLQYRVGIHGSFLETMQARLSSGDYPILRGLTTREGQDASIALLDAWATVADVLTFYQERIANEGYLRTATERRSILELARLIGYRLRPGVSASVYLAFTLENGFDTKIPIGALAQSLPGPGELPQPFETSEPLDAHSEWNDFRPRLSLPQFITPATAIVYFTGIGTNLKPNDPLLIIDSFGDPQFRRVFKAEADASANRTKISLTSIGEIVPELVELAATLAPERVPEEEGPYSVVIADRSTAEIRQAVGQVLNLLRAAKQPTQVLMNAVQIQLPRLEQTCRINKALNFDVIATWVLRVQQQLATILQRLEVRPQESATTTDIIIDPNIANTLEELLKHAPPGPRRKPFADEIGAAEMTRVKTSLTELVRMLKGEARNEDKARAIRAEAIKLDQLTYVFAELSFGDLAKWTGGLHAALDQAVSGGSTPPPPAVTVAGSLIPLLTPLLKPPARRPIDALRLDRPVDQLYAVKADLGPRLLVSLQPALNRTLYQARRSITVKPGPAKACALGTQASLFGHNVPRQITYDPGTKTPKIASEWIEWTPSLVEQHDKVYLDGAIDTIAPTHYLAILKPGTPQPRIFQAKEVAIHPRTDYGISGKTTEITLNIPEGGDGWWQPNPESTDDFAIIRGTVVYAQSTKLDVAEEPIETDVQGDEIELDNLYQDLRSGCWLIVSGERTDITDANNIITGVRASELVMLACVTEDVRKVNSTDALPGETLHTILHLADPLSYTYKRDTVTLYANVVKAMHGETVPEVFGSGDGRKAFQQFALRQLPLTYVSVPTPAGADSTLVVRINDVQWHETNTLAGLGPTDRRYIIRIDDDCKTSFVFGDGKRGARLPTGIENIKGEYRRGIGKAGNVKATQISLLAKKPLHVKSVINPIAASGGADRESRDQARRNAPLAVTALDRLVSVRDYADFARTFAGIGKASAVRLSDGRREVVHLTIAGADDVPIDQSSDLYRNLRRALQQFGEPYQPIVVELRALSLLVISAGARLQPDYAWEFVEPKIRAALLDVFSFDRRELGQDVTYCEVVSAIQAVEGVAYVDIDILDAVDEDRLRKFLELNGEQVDQNNEPTLMDKLNLILKPRLNPDLAHVVPATGRIVPAQLVYLDPTVPDTLILTELLA